MRKIEKLLSLLLALAMCLTLAAPALADGKAPVEEEAEVIAEPIVFEDDASAEAPAEGQPEELPAEEPAESPIPAEAPVPVSAEPAVDSAPTASDLMMLVNALKYLVGLQKQSDPDPEAVRTVGGVLALAVFNLLTAEPGTDPEPTVPPTPTPTPTPEPTPAPEHVLIAVVPDANTVEDNSLNEAAFNAAQAWAEEHEGYDAAAYTPTEKELEAEESPTLPAIRRACGIGADIVICTGFSHDGSIQQAAREYPDVRFLWLDNALEDSSLTNIAAVTFAVEQSGYAAGYAAVKEGYTELGFMGGFSFVPEVCLYGYGYIQGVKAAAAETNRHINVKYIYDIGFGPSPETQALAEDWYNAGTQVIFGAAGGANMAIGQAADAAGGKMIAVDVAPGEDFPGLVTAAIKDVATAVQLMLDKYSGGSWASVGGATTHLDVNDGIDLLPVSGWVMERFTQADYRTLLDELKKGDRTVDADYPADMATQSDARVTINGGSAAPSADELVGDAFIDPLSEWGQYDALISEIKAETDNAKRTELLYKADEILTASGGIVPLYYYNDAYLQKSYVSDVYSNLYGTKWFMYAGLGNGSSTLRVCLAGEPETIDPALVSSVDGACITANSYSGLFTYNPEGECVPACAESCTVSDDGMTWTVTLKDGLKWSNGTALTAADFANSWKRAASSETNADYGYLFEIFEGYPDDLAVTARDSRTLEFTLTAPCAYMKDLMTMPAFSPVKEGAEPGKVTNGAFYLTRWENGSMTYTKNPFWYDADSVTVRNIEFVLIENENEAYERYENGALDFLDFFPSGVVVDDEMYIRSELGTYYFCFNVASPLFADKTPAEAACIRQAVSLLIDRERIVDDVTGSLSEPADDLIPVGMSDGSGGIFNPEPAAAADMDAARERAVTLLEAAGYKFDEDGMLSEETPLVIEYVMNNGSAHAAIAESIRQDLDAVGIEFNGREVGWNELQDVIRSGDFDASRGGWIADINDPINMLELWTSDSLFNYCHFGE